MGESPEVNTQQNSSMQRQNTVWQKSTSRKFHASRIRWKKVELKNFNSNNASNPNILENYDEVSPSEGEIVYLFRFNGKKA